MKVKTVHLKTRVLSHTDTSVSFSCGITVPKSKLDIEIDYEDLEAQHILTFTDEEEKINELELICSAFVCNENGEAIVDETSKRKSKPIKKGKKK